MLNIQKRKGMCLCVCVALSDRKVGDGGCIQRKEFLSRWQLQDWQEAILLGNGVSQPVSLAVRQPLTPLNLAFCWAVTGLALTLHVAGLINFPMKSTRWQLVLMNSLHHNTPTGCLFDGINDKKNSFVSALCHFAYVVNPLNTSSPCSGPLYCMLVVSPMVEHCKLQDSSLAIVFVWKWLLLCQRVRERERKKREVCSISTHIVNPFL